MARGLGIFASESKPTPGRVACVNAMLSCGLGGRETERDLGYVHVPGTTAVPVMPLGPPRPDPRVFRRSAADWP
jgi:hypothetical protein